MKKGVFFLFLIVAVSTLYKLLFFSSSSFFFDEAASWYTSKSISIPNLIIGNHELGELPLFLILSKPLSSFSQTESVLRLLSILTSICFMYIYWKVINIIFSNSRSKQIIAMLLLSLNPAFIYYSIEYRSYLLGAALQLLSLFFFFQLTNTQKKQSIIPFALTLSAALFTSFSSSFLPLFFLIELLNKKDKLIKSGYFHRLLSITMAIASLFALWMTNYMLSENAHTALHNYASYTTDRNSILSSAYVSFSDWINFFPSWIGTESIFVAEQMGFAISAISFAISLGIILNVTKESILYLIKPKNDNRIDKAFYLYICRFIAIFLTGITLCSMTMFNVFPLRLMLLIPLLVPIILTGLLFNMQKNKKMIVAGFALFIIIVGIYLRADLKFFGLQRTKVKETTQHLASLTNNGIKCLFFSHSFSFAEYALYSKQELLSNRRYKYFLINYNSNKQLNWVEKELNNLLLSNNNFCNQIVIYSYFDQWDESHPSKNSLNQLLNSYELSEQIRDGWQFQVEIYNKK